MDKNKIDDDFLGESIDEIFNNKFEDKSNSSGDDVGTFIIEDEENQHNKKADIKPDEELIIVEDDNNKDDEISLIEDEEDIYVLEEKGVEVINIDDNNKKIELEDKSDDLSSFEMDEDFELLENKFTSEKEVSEPEKKDSGFVLDLTESKLEEKKKDTDPLDLDNEFVNLKPPVGTKIEETDFDDFVLENHNQNDNENLESQLNENTPPPIPSIEKDGNEFLLDPAFDTNIGLENENSSFIANENANNSFSLENVEDENDNDVTDGRFFNEKGKPVNDNEILKDKQFENPKPKQPLDRSRDDHGFDMNIEKKNPLLEKKKLLIAVSVIIIVIATALFFIIPGFSGNSNISKKKVVNNSLKDIKVKTKTISPKKAKEIADREKINKLFKLIKKNIEDNKLIEAKEYCKQALNIARTEVLVSYERDINERIAKKKKAEIADAKMKKDKKSYERAVAYNSVNAFKDYIKQNPDGEFFTKAKAMIVKLEKRDYENRLNQIVEKVKVLRKTRLRSDLRKVNKAEINLILNKNINSSNFEVQTIDGDRVLIDYSTGLMWTVAKYSMKLDKAKFWSVRHYAGYYNWRFPTSEEVYSLKGISPSYLQKSSLNGFVVWTGDGDKDSSRNWVLSLVDGKFSTSSAFIAQNLLSVRTIK